MTNQWRRANQSEQAQGFEAVNIVEESIHLGNGARAPYLRQYYYTHAALLRRAKRGDDVPNWFAVDTSEAWLNYIASGETTSEIEAVLKTLGSYVVQRESVA